MTVGERLAAGRGLLRTAVVWELGMWRSLYRWVLRRPLRLDDGAAAFGYTAAVAPLFWVFIVVSAIEVPVFHVILPWRTVRQVVLVLSVYGLFWMVGMLASLKVHPHVVGPSGLRVRHGSSVDLTIPWDAVASVTARHRSLPSNRTVQIEQTSLDRILHIGVSSQTRVDVALREPRTVALPRGRSASITELRFSADDPDRLVARARERLAAAAATGGGE